MKRQPSFGAVFEARVARLLTAEGEFARRRVNLDVHFGERFTVTDADVLSFRFDDTLAPTVKVTECKTTEARSAPSPADRLLWLVGLRSLLEAERSALAIHKPASDKVRRLAMNLGSEVLDIHDISRREAVAGIEESTGWGSHQLEGLPLAATIKKVSREDDDMRRLQTFIGSALWLSSPIPALKRSLGGLRIVAKRWSDKLPPDEQVALRLMSGELTVGLSLALLRIAGLAFRQSEEAFERYLSERLSEGLASYAAMQDVSQSVDRFLLGVLRDAGVDSARSVSALGAFEPKPPSYVAPLAELVQRLAQSPRAAADLCRLADWRVGVAFLGSSERGARFFDVTETSRLLQLVGAFIAGQTGMPSDLLGPILTTPNGTSNRDAGGLVADTGSHMANRIEQDKAVVGDPDETTDQVGAESAVANSTDADTMSARAPKNDPTLFGGS